MKVKFPTNKEVLKIERQRAIKNYHYTMRFVCVFLMMIYVALWFSYKSQSQALDYEVWMKIATVTALMAVIHFCCWFFGFLRHWFKGGIVGLMFILPYVFLLFSLPKKDKVEYKSIEEVKPVTTVAPEIKIVKTPEEKLKETIKNIEDNYPNSQLIFLLLDGMKIHQTSQVREYFDSLKLSEKKIVWSKVPQGEIFIFQDPQISLENLQQLTQRFADQVIENPSLDLVKAVFNEDKFAPQIFNDILRSNEDENARQVKVAAGWFNTLNGYKPVDMQSTLINLKNTDNRAYAADIEKKLVSLLFEPYLMVERALVFEAYINWIKTIDAKRKVVIINYYQQQQAEDQVDDFLLEIAFGYLPEEAWALVKERWLKDLRTWEPILRTQPEVVEPQLLKIYNSLNLSQKKSALKTLAKIGKAQSLRFIEERLKISEIEERIFLKSAASTIKTRLAN